MITEPLTGKHGLHILDAVFWNLRNFSQPRGELHGIKKDLAAAAGVGVERCEFGRDWGRRPMARAAAPARVAALSRWPSGTMPQRVPAGVLGQHGRSVPGVITTGIV